MTFLLAQLTPAILASRPWYLIFALSGIRFPHTRMAYFHTSLRSWHKCHLRVASPPQYHHYQQHSLVSFLAFISSQHLIPFNILTCLVCCLFPSTGLRALRTEMFICCVHCCVPSTSGYSVNNCPMNELGNWTVGTSVNVLRNFKGYQSDLSFCFIW